MKLCVIGAGLSGLVTIKELKDEGHTVICYEQGSATGGVFRPNDGKNPAYEEMSLTVSNYFMAFSSLPPEEPERCFWTRGEYHAYLQRFAATFDLLPHITFQTTVEGIEGDVGGGWLVRTRCNGQVRAEHFDGVAVCSGQFQKPLIPSIKGLARFQGPVLHTLDYQNAAPFAGKRVVCVGLGESGADICHQVAQVADTATLVTRHPPLILPRYWTHWFGKADTIDATNCRVGNRIFSEDRFLGEEVYKFINPLSPQRTPLHAESAFMYEWHKMTNHVFGHFPVKNDVFIQDILAEKLGYNLFGVEEVGPDYVICGDGQRLAADVIIFNTGYQLALSRFENIPAIKAIENNVRRLYKHMLHPDLGASLALIGFIRPDAGGVPACAELQARYWAQLCSGKATLPNPATLTKRIAADAERETRSFYRMPERSTLVRYQRFTDELAALIGCEPKPPLTDPDLLLRYSFGSPIAPWFRLRGPGSDPAAAKAVLKRLPIYFAPLVRVGLVVTATAMATADQLDRLTRGRLGQMLARRRPKPLAFLQRELGRQTINQQETVHSLCEDERTWHNLKYKLHITYGLNPKALHDGLTVAQLVALCTAERQRPSALRCRVLLTD